MKPKTNKMDTKKWAEIKDSVYGKKGTARRDSLERDFETFKVGLLLRQAREEKKLTQQQLGDKKHLEIGGTPIIFSPLPYIYAWIERIRKGGNGFIA